MNESEWQEYSKGGAQRVLKLLFGQKSGILFDPYRSRRIYRKRGVDRFRGPGRKRQQLDQFKRTHQIQNFGLRYTLCPRWAVCQILWPESE